MTNPKPHSVIIRWVGSDMQLLIKPFASDWKIIKLNKEIQTAIENEIDKKLNKKKK